MGVATKMFIKSVALVIVVLVISNARAGPLSDALLSQKGQFLKGKEKVGSIEGHNIRRRYVRAKNDDLEQAESRHSVLSAAYHNVVPYLVTQYGHPGPGAPSFNTQHQGPYSHQYHNQFFGHHHHHNHDRQYPYPHGHHAHPGHNNFYHHHHHHDCNHSGSESSDSSSEEAYKPGHKKPYPSGDGKEYPKPTKPTSPTPKEPIPQTTTEPVYDIDVRLGGDTR